MVFTPSRKTLGLFSTCAIMRNTAVGKCVAQSEMGAQEFVCLLWCPGEVMRRISSESDLGHKPDVATNAQ